MKRRHFLALSLVPFVPITHKQELSPLDRCKSGDTCRCHVDGAWVHEPLTKPQWENVFSLPHITKGIDEKALASGSYAEILWEDYARSNSERRAQGIHTHPVPAPIDAHLFSGDIYVDGPRGRRPLV